jgi:hypothetical protein
MINCNLVETSMSNCHLSCIHSTYKKPSCNQLANRGNEFTKCKHKNQLLNSSRNNTETWKWILLQIFGASSTTEQNKNTDRALYAGDGHDVPEGMEDTLRRGTRWSCPSSPSAASPSILPPIDVLEALSTKFGAEMHTKGIPAEATNESSGDHSRSITNNTTQISNKGRA